MLSLQLPSYSYAKHHGVLVTMQTDPLDTATHQTPSLLVYRKRQITVATINEITRFLGCTPKLETAEDDNLIPWLATLEQEQAVLVAEIILQQNEKIGMVKAKINLARE